MPKPFQYRTGSVIYFQGDAADKIYILQNGKISLVYQDIETGEDVRDSVQPGEFFGVKSALGRFPREENAITLSDTHIMAFTVPEFEAVASANTRIIMKMLKVFSNQLRRVHKQVSRLMAKEEEVPSDGLYNVGDYYLKNKRFAHAKHVFGRYLTYYPSGRYAIQAAKNLEVAESSLSRYGNEQGVGGSAAGAAAKAPPADSAKTADAYYNAVSLVSQEKYQEALMSFKKIVDANADPEWTARSSFEIGRCMFMLKKYEESLKYYTTMFTQYPKHPDIKDAMFIMGQCNEKIGRKDQAIAFYKKILSMAPVDEGTATKVKRALSALGA
ncbi:MAG: cyclic nucleotide-binding domain-containing protein [Treponema sp.]|jgi:CRP-like cAMP-binding protein/predicted negative regulator of RcsB-dependent stress response|nr:cyclic nucleotide-binding domain-containing protein [Treponema sp.]